MNTYDVGEGTGTRRVSLKPILTNGARIEPLQGAPNERPVQVLVLGSAGYHKNVAEALASADFALVQRVATEDALFDVLQREEFDCLIVDRMVGDRNSLELQELIENRIPSPPALILLTAEADRNVILKAFRSGISDVVTFEHPIGRDLTNAVHRAVERKRKAQALVDEIDYLSMLAQFDSLTGVPNRNFLEDRLSSLIATARRHEDAFAAFLIDIANFGTITDVYGHAIGDRALKAFAHKLMRASRASDAFGRLGSNEFLYLVDRDASPQKVRQTGDRLAKALSFRLELDTISVVLTANIGGAMFPFDGRSTDELLNAARAALNAAKAAGGGYRQCQVSQAVVGAPGRAETAATDREKRAAESEVAAAMDRGSPERRARDRRAEHRDRMLRSGRIILGDGFSTIDCVIRDLSPRGARVTVQDHASVPLTLRLSLLDTGHVFDATRRWQRGRNIGLEFSLEEAGLDVEDQLPPTNQPGSRDDT
jgi:diguanylate cyclase (GGDEF)-like protein